MTAMQEENRRNIDVAVRELTASDNKIIEDLNEKVAELRASDQSILADLDVVRQHGFKVEQADIDHHLEMKKDVQELTLRMEAMFEEVDRQLEELRAKDAELEAEDERQQACSTSTTSSSAAWRTSRLTASSGSTTR